MLHKSEVLEMMGTAGGEIENYNGYGRIGNRAADTESVGHLDESRTLARI